MDGQCNDVLSPPCMAAGCSPVNKKLDKKFVIDNTNFYKK